jgi:hypothetical protein
MATNICSYTCLHYILFHFDLLSGGRKYVAGQIQQNLFGRYTLRKTTL